MAGNRCSDTLHRADHRPRFGGWGWPKTAALIHWPKTSPLGAFSWGWPGFAAQVHWEKPSPYDPLAGDGRRSPLRVHSAIRLASRGGGGGGVWGGGGGGYWGGGGDRCFVALTIACWGWPGIAALSTLKCRWSTARSAAGDGRESPLIHSPRRAGAVAPRWGWPGIAAHVHLQALSASTYDPSAGDGRESPLKYTRSPTLFPAAACWGWPGIAAQVHCGWSQSCTGMRWGWPGFTAQVHSG